jgi:WD40 repeat protein
MESFGSDHGDRIDCPVARETPCVLGIVGVYIRIFFPEMARIVTSISKTHLLGADQSMYALNSLAWAGSPIVDACKVGADYGHLLVLSENATLQGVDLESGACVDLCSVALPALTRSGQRFGVAHYRLYASADGKYAAIVVDRGTEGVVVEVSTGRLTMRLNGGDYHADTVPFSACFLRFQGRDVLVHRTEWNRLDVSDPATGEALTERDTDTEPERHLDYFHGQLIPSPDGSRLLDDGWVWHPVGIPRAWSVADWLRGNAWESEDGPSAVNLTMREDWNTPVCWIGNRHVALWGLASWDEDAGEETEQGPGVRILDVTQPKQSAERRLSMDLDPVRVIDLYSCGDRLYVTGSNGTTVWDVDSGARIGEYPGFIARLLHTIRGSLIAIRPEAILELPIAR